MDYTSYGAVLILLHTWSNVPLILFSLLPSGKKHLVFPFVPNPSQVQSLGQKFLHKLKMSHKVLDLFGIVVKFRI